ncbi:putative peptidase [Danaus plexippus plexippus]|uniref:Peptidase n=1 Tax=Danaus plexippus plexippus TaxID=278856 RepID=A0A212EXL6_DANPL|nr:putative peptidase [Danaus plexippus plexippus]
MWVRTVIAVACFGLVVTAQSRYSSEERSYRRNRPSRPSQWRDLADEYDRDEDRSPQTPSIKFPLQAIPYELPIGVRGANLQLLVLPIPTSALNPGASQKSECKLTPEPEEPQIDVRWGVPSIASSPPAGILSSPPVGILSRPAAPNTMSNIPLKATNRDEVPIKAPSYPSYINVEKLDQPVSPPEIPPSVSSKEILEQFLAQAPQAPQLPPVLLSEYDKSERIPHPEEEDDEMKYNFIEESATVPTVKTSLPFQQNIYSRGRKVQPQPSRPRFSQSVVIRGELFVPRADFTEPYTAWWDASSGSSKVDFHGGSTSTYRTVMADKRLQRLEMRVDRSGERAVRRCGKASSYQNHPLDITHPALPDIDLFNFVGYEPDGRVERWQHTVVGREGELGAIQGESLSLKHDLLLIRDPEDKATPILYTVSVNSSILGPNADSYEHRYLDVRRHEQNADFFIPKINDLCDTVELLNVSLPNHLSRLEPLREYIQPHRDQKYEAAIRDFKVKYNRRYIDSSEEAVRTTLLMQHKRFISSGNREGATFELGVNFLGDRLDNELGQLRGVKLEEERTQAEQFPHSRSMLRKESAKLPDNFDWRVKGGVSPVGFQGKCSSCWSFAVSGAVEGALFARTGKLVPLSQQCLVDCAHPFGGKGCKGTWPSHAYDYVKNRGLPALDEYPSYKAKVEQCAEKSVRPVTRISGHVNVTENSLSALKVAIRDHAPTVVIVDAKLKSFVFYKHGINKINKYCSGKTRPRLNHAVLAVGWGDQNEEHFILKNSWSESWGERGFMRIHARSNTCGVLSRPSYPRLEDSDVLKLPGRPSAKDVRQ